MISGKGENYGMSSFELEEKLKLHEEVQETGEFIKFKFLREEKKREKEAMLESYPNLIKPEDEWESCVSKIFLPLSSRNLLEERAKSWWEKIEKHDIWRVRKNVEPALSPWEFLFSREKVYKISEIYKIWIKEIEEIWVRIIREELLRRAEEYHKPRLEEFVKKIEEAENLTEEDLRKVREANEDYKIALKYGFSKEFISKIVGKPVEILDFLQLPFVTKEKPEEVVEEYLKFLRKFYEKRGYDVSRMDWERKRKLAYQMIRE